MYAMTCAGDASNSSPAQQRHSENPSSCWWRGHRLPGNSGRDRGTCQVCGSLLVLRWSLTLLWCTTMHPSCLNEPSRTSELSTEDQLVYQIIKTASNKGIWIKDIRFQSNLTVPRLQKALKNLEGRRLVKTVKCSTSATKKIYMLFDLQPSEELTGGTWYEHVDNAVTCQCNIVLTSHDASHLAGTQTVHWMKGLLRICEHCA